MQTSSPIKRRVSRQIMVGNVPVGGDAPITVQSMTNTETTDIAATVEQIRRLEEAGADIVRVSVPTLEAAEAFGEIRRQVRVPLVSDIHFDYKIALRVADLGSDCLRINPGNIGKEDRIRAVVDKARERGIPIRIGINAGSLGKELLRKYREPTAEALVESALRQIDILDRLDFHDYKLSLKASDIFMTVAAYRDIGQVDCPLHLGITEAGGLRPVPSSLPSGWVCSGWDRRYSESLAGRRSGRGNSSGLGYAQSLRLRSKGINFIACPSCSRQNSMSSRR